MATTVRITVIALISLFLFCGCDENDDDMLFLLDEISDTHNVQFDYYYTDESETSKMYWIGANSKEGSLVISCADVSSVHIENSKGESFTEYISAKGHWSARIVNSNTVVFTFDRIQPDNDDSSSTVVERFNFVGKTKKGNVRADVQVTRFTKSDSPVN